MLARVCCGVILGLIVTSATPSLVIAKEEARVTEAVRDVRVISGRAAPRVASPSDKIADGSALQTGRDSRAELTFPDLTLARIGANTRSGFNDAGHAIEVEEGAILLRMPRGAGVARIRSGLVTVTVSGSTALFEAHRRDYNKVIVLEGNARASLRARPAERVVLHGGQMLVVRPRMTGLPPPVDIDLALVMKTATLVTRFPPLPSLNLIRIAIQNQKNSGLELANPDTISTGLGARDVAAAVRSQAQPSPKSGKPPDSVTRP